MEKPSLEEVKEYFKNAETVECLADKSVNDIDLFPYLIMGEGNFEDSRWFYSKKSINDNSNNSFTYFIAWSPEKGYAKILTYKNTEPKFGITKEQIFKLSEINYVNKEHLNEWFPEAFEAALKAGQWYKNKSIPSTFINCKVFTENEKGGHGLHMNIWSENWGLINFKDYVEATTEEVTEALKKEAVKRGVCNGYFESIHGVYNIQHHQLQNPFYYTYISDILYYKGRAIYSKGIWAEIIPTKTIQEAEKLLKELGHEFKIL